MQQISAQRQLKNQTSAAMKPQTGTRTHGGRLQRCTADKECDDCRAKRLGLQRAAFGNAPALTPPIVNEVLNSAGQPLDAGTRGFMEARFGHNFSNVRVHTDARSAESASAVNARAYTVGSDVVFGEGQFAPRTKAGQQLLAHELAHVIQQRGGYSRSAEELEISSPEDADERLAESISERIVKDDGTTTAIPTSNPGGVMLARACLTAAECKRPIPGSAVDFGKQVSQARPTQQTAQAAGVGRQGRLALALEEFLDKELPGALTNVHGIFVDNTLPQGARASLSDCTSINPPIQGATKDCMFVIPDLESQATDFITKTGAEMPIIGGMPRDQWRVDTLRLMVHEVTHAMFKTAPDSPAQRTQCKGDDVTHELSELTAIIAEFPTMYRAMPSDAGPDHPARKALDAWFTMRITDPRESIGGILKSVRCSCNCDDANAVIEQTFDFVSPSWHIGEKVSFNRELLDKKWKLDWPITKFSVLGGRLP